MKSAKKSLCDMEGCALTFWKRSVKHIWIKALSSCLLVRIGYARFCSSLSQKGWWFLSIVTLSSSYVSLMDMTMTRKFFVGVVKINKNAPNVNRGILKNLESIPASSRNELPLLYHSHTFISTFLEIYG